MTVWLISDTHFGEQPSRRQRASGMDGAALDALIIANWRARIAERDTVWHLGDIGRDWRVLTDLPGTKHLVLAHSSDRRPAIARSGLFASIQEEAWIESPVGPLLAVHDPDPYRGQDRADIVHGHHHYHPPEDGRRSVCVDHLGWGPIALDELVRA